MNKLKKETFKTIDRVNLAKGWLLNSGIQNIDKDEKINGGFNSWYDITDKSYPFIYSEITGYAITTLLYLNKIRGEKILVKRAILAANWLIKNAFHRCGGVKTRYYYDKSSAPLSYSFEGEIIYIFDNGMVLFGLLNLFRETGGAKYLDAAKKIANFLIKSQKQNGLFYATYNAQTNEFEDPLQKWSTQSGSYHAKLALSLLGFYDIVKKGVYKERAKKICYRALKFQNKNGRFITFRDSAGTHLHPHSYSAEGLLYAGIKLNKERFIVSAAKACKWALNYQLDNGGLPSLFIDGKFVFHERSDVLAQILRLGMILCQLERLDEEYIVKLKKLKRRLCSFQYLGNKNKDQIGGFFYGFENNRLNHLNSWCTMFALQAINMYEEFFENEKKSDLNLFI